jgi:thiamine biosynthesis lipoprotein
VPTAEELKSAAMHIDISKLIIDKENETVELCDSEMSLDVGAIAKGYAVEMVARLIEEEYGDGFVLDVGGNLRVIGTKPDGSGWLAGIRNPDNTSLETIVYKTEIKNASLVTSGDYERFYTVDGVRYHHIINSESLRPASYYASVSVMTESSALSDALSTALFNMEYEELRSFVEGHDGIFVIIVDREGEVSTLGEKPFD